MKILKEYTDGFRWHNGNTSSVPFEKDSDLYKEKLEEGYELELMPQSEKDAHEDSLRIQSIVDEISTLESTITPRRLREALMGDSSFIEDVEAQVAELRKGL